MFRFKLIGGNHVEDGKMYSRGSEVLTRHDLVGMFPTKFVLLETLPDDFEEEVEILDHPYIPMPKKEKGVSIPEAPLDLQSDEDDEFKSDVISTDYGQDVSADYPKALENDLKVFRNIAAKGYYVVKSESNEVLNVKAIRKTEVQPFLDEYLE